jgi:peptidyl-prolyl cis-trans isomerase A (cyclophilin A)
MKARSMAFVCMALGVLTAGAPVALAQTAGSGTQAAKPAPKPTTQSGTQTAKPPAKPAGQSGAKPPAKTAATAKPASASAMLKTPSKLKEVAPATYKVNFETSAGPVVLEITRAWAPKAADRFYNLVKYGFYDGARFFRVIPNFMAQFGMNGDPKIQAVWQDANIPDEPTTQSNKRGTISFANAGPNTRSTQAFINFRDNTQLDRSFVPFGLVTSGMEFVDKINAEYREEPQQGKIAGSGNAYLIKEFPRLDYIKKATIVK